MHVDKLLHMYKVVDNEETGKTAVQKLFSDIAPRSMMLMVDTLVS